MESAQLAGEPIPKKASSSKLSIRTSMSSYFLEILLLTIYVNIKALSDSINRKRIKRRSARSSRHSIENI